MDYESTPIPMPPKKPATPKTASARPATSPAQGASAARDAPADTDSADADADTSDAASTPADTDESNRAPRGSTPPPKPTWRRIFGSTWLHLIAAFLIAGLVLSYVAKPYWVPSGSMEQTLQTGDRILANRLAYVAATPGTGDIIVFDANDDWDTTPEPDIDLFQAILRWLGASTGFGPSGAHTLVKRVIGLPGQSVECCSTSGNIIVDGTELKEPYVWNDFPFNVGTLDCDTTPRSLRCFEPVTVPKDSYLVLGDNRAASSDSAQNCRTDTVATLATPRNCWRWATRDGIIGKAGVIIWPVSRWSGL